MDRNSKNPMICVNEIPSLSARRAWIEIQNDGPSFSVHEVALRKESVDRNCHYCNDWPDFRLSLSARRAWIEIPPKKKLVKANTVALRKESVDRNIFMLPLVLILLKVALRKESVDRNLNRRFGAIQHPSRSPQGERG